MLESKWGNSRGGRGGRSDDTLQNTGQNQPQKAEVKAVIAEISSKL
jgi:hypothetical protein